MLLQYAAEIWDRGGEEFRGLAAQRVIRLGPVSYTHL